MVRHHFISAFQESNNHTNCFTFSILKHLIHTTSVLICPYCIVIETLRFLVSCQRSHCWQVKELTVWNSPYFSQHFMLSVHNHLEGNFFIAGVKNTWIKPMPSLLGVSETCPGSTTLRLAAPLGQKLVKSILLGWQGRGTQSGAEQCTNNALPEWHHTTCYTTDICPRQCWLP